MTIETPSTSNIQISETLSGIVRPLILVSLTFALVALGIISLRWRIEHDPPIMLYFAMLIDRFHFVPYRDMFDINMPGSYLLYILIGRLTGNGDLPLRVIDLVFLACLSLLTWRIMEPFGYQVAWFASILFGLAYLGTPNVFTLQREYLLLLPLATATMLLIRATTPHNPQRNFVIGLLLGLCGTVKPHTMLAALMPILLYIGADSVAVPTGDFTKTAPGADVDSQTNEPGVAKPTNAKRSPLWINIGALLLGMSIPLGLLLLYLAHIGALSAFLDIVRNYWPLYGAMSGDFGTLSPSERPRYLMVHFLQFGGYRTLLPFVVIGLYLASRHSKLTPAQFRQIGLIAGLAICFCLYTMLAGGFWTYHWLLFLYFALLLCALSIRQMNGKLPSMVALITCLLLGMKFARPTVFRNALSPAARSPKHGRVDILATYLRAHSHAGDTVQAMDYTGGANHAMLIAGLPSATPFIADFIFYHHISHPYVRRMRDVFMQQMTTSRPRWVIQVIGEDKPWPHGPDTTRHFQALETLLTDHYVVRLQHPDYVLWERKPNTSP